MSITTPLSNRIRRLSSLQYDWLRFSPALELQFTVEANHFRSRRQWLEGLIGIGLYALVACTNQIEAPRRTPHDWLLRFGVTLPLAIAVNASLWTQIASWLKEAGILAVSCFAGTVEIYLSSAWGANHEIIAQLTVVSVLIFTNMVMRLRLTYALSAFLWATGIEFARSMARPGNGFPVFVIVSAIGIASLVANYGQDREARLAFLKHAEKQDLVGSLAQSYEQLTTVALTDPLTGLANRSALNTFLTKTWSELAQTGLTCSVVMIDVDHFKSLNDRYGHLYGDRVLKRFSHLLAEALRGEDDFIARFGGEEFIVVLPRTPKPLACIVAERLRGVIELAGLPALRTSDANPEGLRATVSCGVATAAPCFYPDPFTLIGAADEALYRAKQDGRNRVRGCDDGVILHSVLE